MAEFHPRAKLEMSTTVVLTEAEIHALDALAGYGANAFIEAFYKVMGVHYLRPHEAGLRSLLESVRGPAAKLIGHREQVEKVWRGTHEAVERRAKPRYEPS